MPASVLTPLIPPPFVRSPSIYRMPHVCNFLNAPPRDSPIFSTQLLAGMRFKKSGFFSRFYVRASAPSSFWVIWCSCASCARARNRPGTAGFRADSGSGRGFLGASSRAAAGGPGVRPEPARPAEPPGPSARAPGGSGLRPPSSHPIHAIRPQGALTPFGSAGPRVRPGVLRFLADRRPPGHATFSERPSES
jgi:hypothetical protein